MQLLRFQLLCAHGFSVHGYNRGDVAVFFVFCFLALGEHCPQILCLPGFGTHANTQDLSHFDAFPANIQGHSSPKRQFSMTNDKLPNRPGFAFLPGSLCLCTRLLTLEILSSRWLYPSDKEYVWKLIGEQHTSWNQFICSLGWCVECPTPPLE